MTKTLLFISLYSLFLQGFGNPTGIKNNENNIEIKSGTQGNAASADDPKLSFTRDQAILLTPQEQTFMNLFDGDLTTSWFPGWGAMYPASTLMDLKGTFSVTKLKFRTITGSRHFKVYGGKDAFSLTLIVDQLVEGYDQWIEVPVNANVSFLKLEIPETKTDSPTELEIYGTKIADAVNATATGKFRGQNNINGILGVNSFHWVNTSLETPFLNLREYIETQWIEQEDGKYRYNPSSAGDAMFDEHYAQLRSMGIEIMPCLKGTLPFTRTEEYGDGEFKPLYPLTANPADPASYKKQGEFHFQYAARYGYTKVDESLLEIDPTPRWTADPVNVKKSGLGFIKYFECWNEPDKDWKGTNGYMTPFEFAAYMSAVVDGHCNTLGKGIGIKNADPTAKIVMGGLSSLSIDYVKAMVLWFKTYRPDHTVPLDAFNFHHYSNSAGFQHTAGSVGISPEQDKIREKLKEIKAYVDSNFPGMEIYLSEYGYDSNVGSVQRCEPIGTMSRTEVQGIWNTRSMLELMATQIDKSYVYMMADEAPSEESWGVYANSGMVTVDYLGSEKKPAWFYVNTLKEVLKDFKFISDESPDATIRNYKFTKGTKTVNAVWLTSSADAKASYTLSLPGTNNAEIIRLEDKNPSGLKSTHSFKGTLEIEISERPLFIITENISTQNIMPVAKAGTDQTIVLPATIATLEGTGSDADGTIEGYVWEQKNGPIATLTNNTFSTLSLSGLTPGNYTFQLTVTDNAGGSGIDEVILNVGESTSAVAELILADADKDVEIAAIEKEYLLDLSRHAGTFTFVAKTIPSEIGSVKFLWDGTEFKTVNGAPYSFTDNCWPGEICYNGWWKPSLGKHTVTAIPFSETNGKGTQGAAYSATINVINSGTNQIIPTATITEDVTAADVNAFIAPNPVEDEMALTFSGNLSGIEVSVSDPLGKIFYEEKHINSSTLIIHTEKLGMKPGLYFAKISKSASLIKTLKIIKK